VVPIGEDGNLARGVVETGKLEPDVKRGAIRVLLLQRRLVAGLEALANGGAPVGILDEHEAPGFAQPD